MAAGRLPGLITLVARGGGGRSEVPLPAGFGWDGGTGTVWRSNAEHRTGVAAATG